MLRRINLIPKDVQNEIAKQGMTMSITTLVISLVSIMLIAHIVLHARIAALDGELKTHIKESKGADIKQLSRDVALLNERKEVFINRNNTLLEIIDRRFPVYDILYRFGNLANKKVWLSRCKIKGRRRMCEINGRSWNTHLVSEFMIELKKEPYFESVNLVSMEKGASTDEVLFSLICYLN